MNELPDDVAQLGGVRVLPTSAVTGAGVRALFPAVVHSYESWNRRVSTGLLNRWLEAMVRVHAPPPTGKRTVRLKYMAQVSGLFPLLPFNVRKWRCAVMKRDGAFAERRRCIGP